MEGKSGNTRVLRFRRTLDPQVVKVYPDPSTTARCIAQVELWRIKPPKFEFKMLICLGEVGLVGREHCGNSSYSGVSG